MSAVQETASKKGKAKKAYDAKADTTRLLEAKISQLEREAATDKDQEAEIEREVKRANRDLTQHISKMDDMQKVEHLLRRASELLADMRRLERENQRNKKRGDALQKDKENKTMELGKTTQLKEKLEKLCRELQKDNNKFKNENKTLTDTLAQNKVTHDQKMENILKMLDGYQKEKDNPRQEVVDVSIEELFQHRFRTMIQQYELRELHFQAQMRTKELEVQYHMARYDLQKKATEDEISRNKTLVTQIPFFVPYLSPTPSESSTTRRISILAVSLGLILMVIPYELAYVIACLIQLSTTTRALRQAQENTSPITINFHHYSHSILLLMLWVLPINIPGLIVWFANLLVHWIMPFSSKTNFLCIVGFILLVEHLHTTMRIAPRVTSPQRDFTALLLACTGLFAVVYGVSYAYALHHLVHFIMSWLVGMHYFATPVVSGTGKGRTGESRVPFEARESRKRGKTP